VNSTSSGRADRLLPLLRALTVATPDWTVWKNVESALGGTGDVDSAAPRRAWPIIARTFHQWAADQELGPTFSCLHIPRTANHFALLPGTSDLLQLEVKAGATYRGSVQFHAEDVLALSCDDDRGFRKLRPGAEGLLKLLNNGSRRLGRPDWEGLRAKDVVALLQEDPEGVAAMAARFGPARAALTSGVRAVLDGQWDRRAMLAVEGWAVAKAVVQPHVVAERVWFRLHRKRTCPVLQVVYRQGRTAPADLDAWLSRVARIHTVTGIARGRR
jgi:hypothetical protein